MNKTNNPTYTDFIGVYENIVDPNLCDQLINYFETSDRWSQVPPTNRSANWIQDQQLVIDAFNKGLASQVMIPFRRCFQNYIENYPLLNSTNYISSTVLVQKTLPCQGYHAFHTENNGWDLVSRTMAWMIYLNDVPEGGETEFLYQKRRFKPTTGTILIWPGGYTHMHRGNPPMSTKYIATGWVQCEAGLDDYKLKVNPLS